MNAPWLRAKLGGIASAPKVSVASSKKRLRHVRSLFGEIMDWMLLPLVIIWPLSVGITYLVAQHLAAKPFDQGLEDNVRALSIQTKAAPLGSALNVLPLPARNSLAEAGGENRTYQVTSISGELISGDPELNPAPPDDSVLIDVVRLRDDNIKGTPIRVAYAWVIPKQGANASDGSPVLVQVAEGLGKREQLARDITSGIVLPQVVIMPLSVLLVYFGLTRGLRPLSRLADRLRRRAPNDMSAIAENAAPLELQPLLMSMNGLISKLDSNIATQKRFIADAAHQMKTPLAGLRMQAELALRQTDPAELRESLHQLARSSERATHVINQLLSLARTEHRGNLSTPITQTLRLNDLAADVTRELVPLALERGIDLGFEAEPLTAQMAINGDALMLKELTKNLVDNAIFYTPRGGSVTVRVHALPVGKKGADSAAFLALEVEDTGPGIPPTEHEHIFQPFYRILENANANQNGSGLGLAIVKEIAQQHKAEIRISPNPHQPANGAIGCLIQVCFPIGMTTQPS